jgi:hypothetical protein
VHSDEGRDEASEARGGLSRLGSEKGRRVALQRARINRQLTILTHAIEDAQDDLVALTKALKGVQEVANELAKSVPTREELFGPEWP